MTSVKSNSVKIGFIGLGKLGLPCAEVMAECYDVAGYDIQTIKTTQPLAIKSSIEETGKIS